MTSLGEFTASWKSGKLYSVRFPDEIVKDEVSEEDSSVLNGQAILAEWLQRYCAGAEQVFPDNIEIDYSGYSDFTRKVLEKVAAIAWGETRTYCEIAAEAGKPRAARAAGNAIGSNRVPVIIPCHRVVRADGQIGGFTGGTHWKVKLLQLEKVL